MELETKLKCFIPDYIPSIGNIDPFIKVPRPDGKPDELGLTVLDEPHSQQSDSTVLEMQLRAVTKKSNLKEMAVACIENAEKDTGRISRWIDNIEELHRSKPPPGVVYVLSFKSSSSSVVLLFTCCCCRCRSRCSRCCCCDDDDHFWWLAGAHLVLI